MSGVAKPSDQADFVEPSATAARRLIEEGKLASVELVEACLARVGAREAEVGAFAFLDPHHARRGAEACDAARRAGRPQGPLHGLPVAVKDIFDTADMPTENGTALHAGRRPRKDAHAVARLRAAGAVILGKTVTAEMANLTPGRTRNPHDLSRTPGGSSQGSAAAVADRMAPLAIGTQTNGSVIRPASYCGVVGFKPSFGLIGRSGALCVSRHLDQVGVFARDVADAALLADALVGHDPDDPDSLNWAAPRLSWTLRQDWPLAPDLAFVRTPVWDQADADTRAGFEELAGALGERARRYDLPDGIAAAWDAHRCIMEADLAVNFAPEWTRGRDRLSPALQALIERGLGHGAHDYIRALAAIPKLRASLDPLFERADAILTPAAAGEAPRDLASTGSPAFCTLWSLLGLPAVILPLLTGANGLPIGVQLVGRHGEDARLLRTAAWLARHLEETA